MADQRIGRYHIDGVVGAGAFATVYRAFDERLEDAVALKVLAENHSLDPEIRERFLTEGRVLRRIDSSHVVTVHDLGETDRHQPYLVLELADRGTLADRVAHLRAQGWHPTAHDVHALASPLAAALRAVHTADVVHRDLSPGNVLLRSTRTGSSAPSAPITDGGVLLLADLGMCKDLALHSGHTVGAGTEGFRPPEQRAGLSVIDATADLWALSALVVWLVTGSPPGDGSVRGPVVAAGLPAQLAAVLDTSLSRDPRSRHPDPRAWLDAVTGALAMHSAGPPPVVPEGRMSDRTARRPRSRAWRVAVGAGAFAMVAAVAAVLVLVWLLRGPQVTDLGGGQVRVARADGDVVVAIIGPARVSAGGTAVFEAQFDDGAEAGVWVTPEGEILDGTRYLQVETASPGVASVTLIGVAPTAAPIVVTHELRVTDAE